MSNISLVMATSLICCISLGACGKNEPLKMVFVSGSNEYSSNISLEKYKNYLENNYENVQIALLKAGGELKFRGEYSDLQGLEALDNCDVALFFTRRLTIDGEQLEAVKRYATSGRPIVGIRTASHGFQNWLEFDTLVLGGNYDDHYGDGPPVQIKINSEAKNHPVLKGIDDFSSEYSLYKTSPVASDAEVLISGTIPFEGPERFKTEPVAWTRTFKGARVCYISLGGLSDWDNPAFRQLVTNALFWTANREL